MKTFIIYTISILVLLLTASNNTLAEQTEKTRPRIFIEYFNTAINERYLTLKVTTRINKRHRPVPGAEVKVYLDSVSESSFIGNVLMNSDGLATFHLPPKFYKALDSISVFTFICTISDHPNLDNGKKELMVKEIELKAEFIDQDTLKWIRAIVLEKTGQGSYAPVQGVPVQFLVIRPFNMLAIAEQTSTDEDGKATILFPDDLPGDATGHLVPVIRIDDSDDYGTVESKSTVQWGVPTAFSDNTIKRSLWAAGANAPLYLLILTNGLIIVTWGIIFYILFQVYRISRL